MRKWIVIGIVLVLLVAGVLVYRSYQPNQSRQVDEFTSDEQGFSFSGEMGDLEVGYTDPATADFGVPIYPGAVAAHDEAVGEVNINGKSFLMGAYTASDTKANVVSYYEREIEGAIVGSIEEGEQVQTIIKAPNETGINISTKDSKTSIVIVKPL